MPTDTEQNASHPPSTATLTTPNPLRVYVASPWVHKGEALVAQRAIEALGLEVSSRWITQHEDVAPEDPAYEAFLQEQAIIDLLDVASSDIFLILNLAKSEGKATELGFALFLGISPLLVGPREGNIFYHLPQILQFPTLEGALVVLKEAHEALQREWANTPQETL